MSPVHALDPLATFDFEATTHGFGGGSQSYSNPATGGVGNSGYLSVTNNVQAQLGARSFHADLIGDYVAAQVTAVRVSLSDVEFDDALELHLVLGVAFSNVWQSNVGVDPPNGSWQEYVFDVTDSSQWTQIQGAGTFADALATTNRFVIRHDEAPYVEVPNTIAADFGMDQIRFDVTEAVPATSRTGLVGLALALLGASGLILRRRLHGAVRK
jgi:hypothetical protein